VDLGLRKEGEGGFNRVERKGEKKKRERKEEYRFLKGNARGGGSARTSCRKDRRAVYFW